MPLETPRWQAILNNHHDYFPHINPHRPRPLDPLRYLLQSLWLLATHVPEPDKKATGVRWRRWKGCTGAIPSGWKSCRTVNARTGHLDKHKELAHLNPKLRGDSWRGRHFLAGAGAAVYYPAL
jgi:cellulose synthase (UDP-forming)